MVFPVKELADPREEEILLSLHQTMADMFSPSHAIRSAIYSQPGMP